MTNNNEPKQNLSRTQTITSVVESRLQSMSDMVTEVQETGPDTVAITLTVSDELAGASAAVVLNQSVVLAISKLNELQEDSLWCKLSEVKLLPIEGNSVMMNVLFSVEGA